MPDATTLPSCFPEEHGGSSGSALPAALGCLQVSSPLPLTGREQPLALSLAPAWCEPSTHGQPGSANTEVPSFSLLSMSVPLQAARVVTCMSPCVSAMRINHHSTWSCHKGPTDIDKRIHKPGSVYTAVQVCLTWQSLFVWTGWRKTRASSWREMVPPCTQTSPACVCCTPSKTPPLYELCNCIHL